MRGLRFHIKGVMHYMTLCYANLLAFSLRTVIFYGGECDAESLPAGI